MGNQDKDDIPSGTLYMLILKTLERFGEMHGYGIAEFIQQISDGVLQVEEGSLYPALQRMLIKGWVVADWKQTENNRRAKFYSLSRLGKKQLESEAANWQRLSAAISHVVQLSEV